MLYLVAIVETFLENNWTTQYIELSAKFFRIWARYPRCLPKVLVLELIPSIFLCKQNRSFFLLFCCTANQEHRDLQYPKNKYNQNLSIRSHIHTLSLEYLNLVNIPYHTLVLSLNLTAPLVLFTVTYCDTKTGRLKPKIMKVDYHKFF